MKYRCQYGYFIWVQNVLYYLALRREEPQRFRPIPISQLIRLGYGFDYVNISKRHDYFY